MPSRSMSVWMMAAAPASSKDSARSSAETLLTSAQPSVATMPSLASMPTATLPGKALQAARAKYEAATGHHRKTGD